jgi:DNA polymerase III epsilon subunit-like protein
VNVFLDFEASSLSDQSFPVEVAWVFQDGRSESHLIRPAPEWTDWDDASQAIHGISRETLASEGDPHDKVAARMVEALSEHDLFASAPSWDGKWLSVLLRGAGLPRHALRLRDTDEALRATATEILRAVLPKARLDEEVRALVSAANAGKETHPAHRALADAQGEYDTWCRLRQAARELAARQLAAQSGGA